MDFFGAMTVVLMLLFWGVFLFRTAMQMRRGRRPLVLGLKKQGAARFLECLFFVGFPLWTYEVLAQAASLPKIFPDVMETPLWRGGFFGMLTNVAALILMLLGLGLFVWALVSFGDSWRIGIDQDKPGQLVTGGAFAFSRNPIFTAMDLYVASAFLMFPTVVLLLIMLGMIGGIHAQILQEERFLGRQYGAGYAAYRHEVRRYL